MLGSKLLAIDTETTGLNAWQGDQPFAVGFMNEKGEKLYKQYPVNPETRQVIFSQKDREELQSYLADPEVPKLFFHANHDVTMLDRGLGIKVAGPIHCILIKSQVFLSGEISYKLKRLCKKFLGIDDDDERDLKELVKHYRRQKKVKETVKLGNKVEEDYWLPNLFDPEDEKCKTYCLRDCLRALQMSVFLDQIGTKKLQRVYRREMKLWPRVYRMQKRGVRVSRKQLKQEVEKAEKSKAKEYAFLNTEYKKAVKGADDLNPDSPQQLVRFLYDGGLGLECIKWTDKGNPSTDIDALKPYLRNPIVGSLLRFKAASKSLNTFFGKYYDLSVKEHNKKLDRDEWVLHAQFRQNEAITGRFSCAEPNLQQVSEGKTAQTKGAVPIFARRPFLVRKGYVWLLCDYAQLEARVVAHLAQEPFMLAAFAAGRDLHAEMANRIFGGEKNRLGLNLLLSRLCLDGVNPADKITKQIWKLLGIRPGKEIKSIYRIWRRHGWDIVKTEKIIWGTHSVARNRSKNMLYLSIYGGGAAKFAQDTGLTKEEAQQILRHFFRQFPKIKGYQRGVIRQGEIHGGIETVYGRWIKCDKGFEYKLIDYSIQSPSADLIKRAMRKSGKYLDKHPEIDAHMIMQIHDELVFEVRESQCTPKFMRKIRSIMEESGLKGFIHTPIDMAICRKTWAEKEDIELPRKAA